MKITIAYSSNSGSTYLVADQILNSLPKKYSAELVRAEDVTAKDLAKADLVLFGSPSWLVEGTEAMPHEFMIDLLKRLVNEKKFTKSYAVFGCGNSNFTHFCGAVDYIDSALKALGGKRIVENLKIDSYYLDIVNNQKSIDRWVSSLLKIL